jgi:20S proteasome alpha/beta subunit
MIQPLLDEVSRMEEDIGLWEFCKNVNGDTAGCCLNITEEAACKLALDVFGAAAERHITVGDNVEILVIKCDRIGKEEDTGIKVPKVRRFIIPLSRH